jgi:glutathione S-transferase
MVLEVYGDLISGPVRAIVAFLKLNNIEHEFKVVSILAGDHKKPEFLAINPNGQMPTIVDDGFVLWETTAILQYLATTRDLEETWYPADARKRSLVHRFNSWYHPNLRQNGALLFFKKRVAEKFGITINPAEIEEMEAALPNTLATMDRWIKENGGFLAGDHLTISDMLGFCETDHLVTLMNWDISRYGNLLKWYTKLSADPVIVEISETLKTFAKE